jgi:hypothetical protein
MKMFDVRKNTIYYARHGSHAYGTNIATSDEDFRGVAVAPKSHVMGFAHTFEQQEIKGQEDSVIFDLRKFMGLAAECNPNIIEVLFVDDSDVLECTPAGRLLLDNRHHFLSKKAKFTFSGYAVSQLKRIRTHRSYLLSPPDHKPTREEFGLSTRHKITADMMGAMDKLVAEDTGEVDPNVIELVQKEKQYKSAMAAWNSHEKWKKERNAARADTEAQYGYDTKHGMHLVRLLRMCREILSGDGVKVRRPDAQELLAIRRGEWSYDQLISWAEKEDREMESLYATSMLPTSADTERMNDLCVRAHELHWSLQ